MIEVKIDFTRLKENKIYNAFWGEYQPKEMKRKMYGYLSEKLNLPLRFTYDAFKDFYWFLNFKEYGEFEDEDENEWKSKEEFLQEKIENSSYGLKNENGIRDDLRIIFVNFNKFKEEYPEATNELLKLVNNVRKEILQYFDENDNDLLNIQIVIES